MKCPRRAENTVTSSQFPEEDTWRKVGRDRCCSYCGSLHPDDFFAICREASKPDGAAEVEGTDKGYKLYARWSDTGNASKGGIKFYTHHFRDEDRASAGELENLIRSALVESGKRIDARHAALFARLGSTP